MTTVFYFDTSIGPHRIIHFGWTVSISTVGKSKSDYRYTIRKTYVFLAATMMYTLVNIWPMQRMNFTIAGADVGPKMILLCGILFAKFIVIVITTLTKLDCTAQVENFSEFPFEFLEVGCERRPHNIVVFCCTARINSFIVDVYIKGDEVIE